MASIKLISEDEAAGKVKDIYAEIKATLGIDFVPNMYRAMASKPDYLESQWRRSQAIMGGDKLDALDQRDHRPRRLGGDGVQLLNHRSYFRGAEVRPR